MAFFFEDSWVGYMGGGEGGDMETRPSGSSSSKEKVVAIICLAAGEEVADEE